MQSDASNCFYCLNKILLHRRVYVHIYDNQIHNWPTCGVWDQLNLKATPAGMSNKTPKFPWMWDCAHSMNLQFVNFFFGKWNWIYIGNTKLKSKFSALGLAKAKAETHPNSYPMVIFYFLFLFKSQMLSNTYFALE